MDVGCGAGQLGAVLKNRGCFVVGVEPDSHAAAAARTVLDEVIVDRAERFHREDLVGTFDTILLLDVLEHVPEPLLVLTNLRKYLEDGGKFIISVPNAVHWTVRKMILRGKFYYEEYGILDRNHLRFFSWGTFVLLLQEAGLILKQIRYDFWLNSPHYMQWYLAPFRWLGLLRLLPNRIAPRYPKLFAYQFLVKAVPKAKAR
jgi:SAM-dependent methyltransferase